MKCKHCMNHSGEGLNEGMPKDDVLALMADLHKCNVAELYITGGEPLLYPYIKDVFLYAASIGMKIILATNGMEIEQHLNVIKECVDTVSISFDGIGETHDIFRGYSGSYKHSVEMLYLLARNNIRTRISTVIWKQNVNQLEEIILLAKTAGAVKVNFSVLVTTGRAKNETDIHLPAEEQLSLIGNVSRLVAKHKTDVFDAELRRCHPLLENSIYCIGGKTILHIDVNGRISPCSWLSKSDIENEFSFYWRKGYLESDINCMMKRLDVLIKQRVARHGFSGCPALAYFRHGSLLSEDPLNSLLKFSEQNRTVLNTSQ